MKKIHFLGIGGSGASAAAAIAQAQGYEITGCDNDSASEFLKPFSKNQFREGHSASHIGSGKAKIDLLVVTPAIFSLDPNNSELEAAKAKNIPILTWQKFAGEYLMQDKFVIAVSGTHGKSTTTAMVSLLMEDVGLDPTVILGAVVPKWEANYKIGGGEYFLIEADEFNDNYFSYTPDISVITNIEMDHPEYFKDFEAVKDSFKQFLITTKQTIIANLSDPIVEDILASHIGSGKLIIDYSKYLIDFPLKIPGEYNILNASAAYQVGLLLNIDPKNIKQSLENYAGIGRRFEFLGKLNGAQIYTDFGHHPTEIKVTIQAAKEKFPNHRIWLIYQPHMFSRTKALFNDFVKVFRALPVDGAVILDIYPSREVDTGIVNSKQLVEAIGKENVEYVSDWEKFKQDMQKTVIGNDVLFFMGAGDIDKLAKSLIIR